MSETTEPTNAPAPAVDATARYASLLASGERVILVRQRHWLTFLEAGRWFVLALAIGLVLLFFGSSLDDGGISGFFGTILDWGFWLFLTIGVLGVGWYFLVWHFERYLVTTRRVIEAGGVINKYTRDTSLSMITDMLVGHPWLGRIVGYGEIDLLTGSEAGTEQDPLPPGRGRVQEGAPRREARVRDGDRRRARPPGGGRRGARAARAGSRPPPRRRRPARASPRTRSTRR